MKTVYIVDDSIRIRERLVELLSDMENVRVIGQADNAAAAVEAILRLRPDTVILDIRLPGRSGLTVLDDVKAKLPCVTVIVISNYDYPQYRRQSMDAGADYFFNKTREFESLLQVLKR
jgi:DNA-binding NarL/FixJ family response regulator